MERIGKSNDVGAPGNFPRQLNGRLNRVSSGWPGELSPIVHTAWLQYVSFEGL